MSIGHDSRVKEAAGGGAGRAASTGGHSAAASLPSLPLRYGAAVLAVAVVVAFRLAAWPLLHGEIPWILFAPAIVIAAWYGGLGAGLAATLLSALATVYFLLEPRHVVGIHTASEAIGVTVFVATGALISVLVERMRAAREALGTANAQLQAQTEDLGAANEELQCQQEELEVTVGELRRAQDALCRANEELRAADRGKNEFLAMLGHELRNPLAAISGAVELMRTIGLASPMLERARNVAARQSAHMARLLDDLLDVARVTQGRIALKEEETDLCPVIASAVEAATPLIESRAQTLALDIAGGVKVKGDAVRLAQVVSNLLDNAAKYTPPRGHIWLEVRREGCEGVIRVRDDGTGIAPDLLPHLFDVFTQGERTLGRPEGGLGVGLTMVKQLVAMHGGTVEAHSAGPGQGSEFVVRLPVLGGLVGQSPCDRRAREGQTLGPAKRILLVEDHADAAELLAIGLELDGHDVVVAHDGRAALQMAVDYRPDVVLLDLGLPEMDGYEVAARLRKMPGLADTPLVAVTGYGQAEDRERTAKAGFAHHLVKPLDAEALRRVLQEVPSRGGQPGDDQPQPGRRAAPP